AQITNRSLTLQAGATDGGSKAGGVVNHQFAFTLPGGSNVGSIKFEYCTTATLTACVMPTGLVTTSGPTALGNETGATGFTLNKTTNGAPYLTRTAAAVGTNQAVTYRLDNVTNPTTNNATFFVRIATYASNNVTGSPIDTGTVNASTAEPIVLTGIMPESLIFCTGATVNTNCTTTTAGTIAFNQLFSPTDTATATSQMSASTNAGGGYAITVNGTTLSSGANTIPAMAAATVGTKGTGQFGMNLKLNTTATSTVAIGAEITPVSDNVDLTARNQTGYDTVDTFKFVSGNVVADSGSDGTPGPTNSQVYTASYIVNVAGNQLAGTYTTTLTYVCTPTF
ncbi:MAG: hypothetical protein ABIR46_01130, partial [Candidatus Saccharimonadales bacterium]